MSVWENSGSNQLVTTFHCLNTLAAKIAAKIASVNGTWEFTFLSFSVANTTRTLKAGRETAWQIPSSKQFSINQLNVKLPDMFWKVRGSFQTCSLSLQVRASTLFTNTKENGITNPAFSSTPRGAVEGRHNTKKSTTDFVLNIYLEIFLPGLTRRSNGDLSLCAYILVSLRCEFLDFYQSRLASRVYPTL